MNVAKNTNDAGGADGDVRAPGGARNIAVSCRGVTKEFGSGEALVRALRGIDLDVYAGELTLLVGPSGCGKTTLLSVVCGILDATGGSIQVLGTDIAKMS